jgi:3-hydroxyisobutyrate dehydrogenase-like beta-hydroxyacid dehydrogenase
VVNQDKFSLKLSHILPLAISIEAIDRILTSAQQTKINTAFPEFASALLAKAQNAGYANQELASLIKVHRQKETHVSLETA